MYLLQAEGQYSISNVVQNFIAIRVIICPAIVTKECETVSVRENVDLSARKSIIPPSSTNTLSPIDNDKIKTGHFTQTTHSDAVETGTDDNNTVLHLFFIGNV